MKKFFTLIMGMLLLCSSIWARTPEEAAAIASGFMSQKGTQENVVQRVRKAKSVSVAPTTVSLEYTQLTPANENAVYVFNHADDGFVLVSAMDESREVLGYSDSGRFDKNDIPENMQFWLQMYASELARADVNKPVLKPGQTAIKRAPKTPAASYPVITPILGNVMWGQDKPYNNLCPVVNGERSVTGCVATAISQIMYVHKHPIKGTGSHSYTSADGVYASANFGSTTYDWNNMLPYYSNNYNTTQANAVATLMYHVGVSADMAYSPDGSGATSSMALAKMGTYFSYDKGIKTWPKDFLTEEEILSAVANDLSIGHPVYLSGATKNDEGHAFVCDGMKSDGYLHINWGWDGVANGYFVLSALDPESQGTGGSASDLAFTERVVVYTGIQPDQGGEAEPLVTVDAMNRTSADEISRNSKVSFSLDHFASAGMGTAKGTVCYYIYDTNDNLVETIGIGTFELETGYYYTNPITTSVAIPTSVANGEYKLEIGYTDDEGAIHPILVRGKGVVRMPMTVSSSSITFGDASGGENTGLKAMSVIDVINQGQSNSWQIDLYSGNFWEDTPSETDVLIRLTLNSSNPYSIVGSYVLDGTGSAGTISSVLYAEGYYQACYQYAPEDMHLTITADANGALQLQYCMLISGVELKGSATINIPNWYVYINENYYYYQSYITYDLSATIPASKALAMTQTLSHTDLTEMSYFVEGRISSMRNTPEQIASFGTARFDISDDGTTKEQFYCYNTKWINNSSFVTGTEVALGDDVVVYGQLQNYLGTTPEMKGYVYQHTSNSNSGSSTAITYELNGGVTNDYGWMSKNDMFQACMADAGVTTLASLEELKAAGEASLATICIPLGTAQCQAILDDEKWDWLESYIMNHQNADAAATVLTEGAASAGWRYAIAAFFLEMQRASWPKSADFSQAGKVEAFQPAWQHGFANPTDPTEEFVLNAPYKEGSTFDGWFATADFSGEKVKTVNAETTGTLYAKWIEYVPTIAEVKALADDTETKVAGVVNFISGKNVYIQDATGGILLYVTETPDFHVGDKIIVKGVKVMYGGAPEVKNAVVESSESSDLFDVTVFEDLSLLLSDTEFAYFGTRIAVNGVKIVSYDSYNNPTVEDLLGNQAVCYKMVLDPIIYPIGTKVSVTAVAAWYNGFQFVGDVSGIEKVVAAKQDNYIYPVRDNKYSLVNDWVISNMEGNFAANKPGNTDMVRGMAAKDGILYFIDRGTASIVRVDGNTGEMLDPIKIIGEHLFEVEKDGEWVSDVMLAYNDIKFDQAGNCLIGACISASATCQTFFIYTVDLETGVATELINDVLWDNPGLDSIAFRFDAFGVAGDVTKNGVIMAADATSGSWNTYRWLIQDGVAGEGEQVAVLLDPAVDQSLYINAAGFGTAPQIFPQDEEGSLFYVDGFNTLPMLFYGNPDEGAVLIDDFINAPYGTKVWNNKGSDDISMNQGFNGLVEFQVGEEYFLLMVAMNNVGAVPTTYALFKFADADRAFAGMEPLWYFPHNGLGTATIGCRTATPSVDVVSDTEATLYLYATNNGYAAYTLTIDPTITAVEDVEAVKVGAEKVIENGQIFILKNGVKYNALGAQVK